MRTSLSLLVSLLALGGCWGGDLDFTPMTRTELSDTYGSLENPVRSAYALGAEVVFSASLGSEDEGREVRIEIVGDGLTAVRMEGAQLFTEASSEGSGEVVLSVGDTEISRHPYEVRATDRVAYRRILDLLFREDLEGVELVVPEGAITEVIVDYYAGDLRLYGRGITASDDVSVRVTENNDRFLLDTAEAGEKRIDFSVAGGATSAFEFEVVDHIDAITIFVDDNGDGTLSARAEARDSEGRLVRSPVNWAFDGVPVDFPVEQIPLPLDAASSAHTLSATLLDATASVEVMAELGGS